MTLELIKRSCRELERKVLNLLSENAVLVGQRDEWKEQARQMEIACKQGESHENLRVQRRMLVRE